MAVRITNSIFFLVEFSTVRKIYRDHRESLVKYKATFCIAINCPDVQTNASRGNRSGQKERYSFKNLGMILSNSFE